MKRYAETLSAAAREASAMACPRCSEIALVPTERAVDSRGRPFVVMVCDECGHEETHATGGR